MASNLAVHAQMVQFKKNNLKSLNCQAMPVLWWGDETIFHGYGINPSYPDIPICTNHHYNIQILMLFPGDEVIFSGFCDGYKNNEKNFRT